MNTPRIVTIFATLLLMASARAPGQGPEQVELGWINAGDGSLYYEMAGEGESVVLIHGGFMDAAMWDDQFVRLARTHRVIRYDMRGFGRSSDPPQEPYSAEDDLIAVLDHVEADQAHLVGLSMGGSLAIDFALAHPDRVRSLVLAEPGLGGYEFSEGGMADMRGIMEAMQNGDREELVRVVLGGEVFASARENSRAWARIRDQVARNASLEPDPMKMLRPLAAGRLAEIRVPTLVLVSEHASEDARRITRKLAEEIEGAELREIQGAGHMINLEQPERFNRAVRRFLDSLGK